VDYLNAENKLSASSANLYRQIRAIIPVFSEDAPLYEKIKDVTDFLKNY